MIIWSIWLPIASYIMIQVDSTSSLSKTKVNWIDHIVDFKLMIE